MDTVCATLVLEPRPDTVTGTVMEVSNLRLPLLGVPTAIEVPAGRRAAIATDTPVVEMVAPLEVRVNVVLTGRSVTTTVTDEADTPATLATLLATVLVENVARLMVPSCSWVLTLFAARGGDGGRGLGGGGDGGRGLGGGGDGGGGRGGGLGGGRGGGLGGGGDGQVSDSGTGVQVLLIQQFQADTV